MNADPLRELLKQADADVAPAGPHVSPEQIIRHVRGRVQRRRAVQRIGSVAAAVVLAVGLTTLWGLPQSDRVGSSEGIVQRPTPSGSGTDTAAALALLADLDRQAAVHTRMAKEIQTVLERDRRTEALLASLPPDPIEQVRREIEKTAEVLVRQGDYLCGEKQLCKSAAAKYERVIELFPNSPWAGVAQRRLAEISEKGELS